MNLFDLFSRELYDDMLDGGYIRERVHPTLPLVITGYTEKTQFEKKWNAVTVNCRGLIYTTGYEIVARPFAKFFNLGEGPILFDMDAPVEVSDKMDGSLGILYPIVSGEGSIEGYNHLIATRGSFDSDQARHATTVWMRKYKHLLVPSDWTFLFEIVYPENRIVLDYGGMDDLILLGAVHKEYGYIYGPVEAQWLLEYTGPVAEVFHYKTMQEAFNAAPRPNAEGYVIRSGNKMVKMKQTDYMELHKLISNLSEKSVWAGLSSGKTAGEICEALPDEFHGFVKETAATLFESYSNLSNEIVHEFTRVMSELGINPSRRDFAFAVTMSPYRKYMFLLLDNKDITPLVWDDIKPRGDSKGIHGL